MTAKDEWLQDLDFTQNLCHDHHGITLEREVGELEYKASFTCSTIGVLKTITISVEMDMNRAIYQELMDNFTYIAWLEHQLRHTTALLEDKEH